MSLFSHFAHSLSFPRIFIFSFCLCLCWLGHETVLFMTKLSCLRFGLRGESSLWCFERGCRVPSTTVYFTNTQTRSCLIFNPLAGTWLLVLLAHIQCKILLKCRARPGLHSSFCAASNVCGQDMQWCAVLAVTYAGRLYCMRTMRLLYLLPPMPSSPVLPTGPWPPWCAAGGRARITMVQDHPPDLWPS